MAKVRRREPAPPVSAVTLGAAVAALGLAVAGDRIGLYHLSVTEGLAVVLATIGLGLVAGALVGGGRLLLVPALALVPLTVVGGAVDNVEWGGDRMVAPSITADIPAGGYDLGAGELTVDLRDLAVDGTLTVPIDVGTGSVRVLVPSGVDVEARVDIGLGQVVFGERKQGGPGLETTLIEDAEGTTDRIVIDLELGLGVAEITQLQDTGR